MTRLFQGILVTAVLGLSACESSDGGGSASVSMYYGVGYYDPWYYGGYYGDIIVTPPIGDIDAPHPEHPISGGGGDFGSRPTPMPSIPSASPRGGGGGFRR